MLYVRNRSQCGSELVEIYHQLHFATSTLEEGQKQNKADDVWIFLQNKVYNITNCLENLPGGNAKLIGVVGTDATEAFEELEAGHSDEASEEFGKYDIGNLPVEVSIHGFKGFFLVNMTHPATIFAQEHAEIIEFCRPTASCLTSPNVDYALGLPTGQHIVFRETIDGQSVACSYTSS